jgi:phage tail-like protein
MKKKILKPPKRSDIMSRNDPYRQFRFRVEIDGITQAGFSECKMEGSSTEIIEYREGADPTHCRKLSGLTKYGNITLKWGVTDSTELWTWYQTIIQMGVSGNRKNMSITLVDEAGADKTRWEIVEAWPVKFDPPDFNAKLNEVAIELMEITCESWKRVK